MGVTPAARAFYNRHFMLTVLLPAYLMALLSYGLAYALVTAAGQPFGLAFVFMVGLSRIFAWLGFMATGVLGAQVKPSALQLERLRAVLAPPPIPGESDLQAGVRLAEILQSVRLLDLGPVPYLASGGVTPGQLWISTWTLEQSDPDVLRCMLQHEIAHSAGAGGCSAGIAWGDLSWLLAWPLAYMAAMTGQPLLLLLAGLIHVSLWLHLGQLMRQRSERRADRAAAELLGRERYARALTEHLAQFEAPVTDSAGARLGRQLRYGRLRGLSYAPDEAEALIDAIDRT